MEGEIAEGSIGSVGKYDLEFKGGQLVLMVDANLGLGSAGIKLSLDAGKVIEAIEKAIPGQMDDAILELLKGALIGEA